MVFKELLKSVTFDDVWTELNKEYSLKNEAYKVYLDVYNQLKVMAPGPNYDGFRLAVAKVEDEFEPEKFFYDVFGVSPENKERYALEMLPWEEWLSLIVIEKCVETYGLVAVVTHSLYELTFFGYDAVDVAARIEKEYAILKERQKEIENGTAEYVSWNELCEEFGYVDDRTEEEKELEYKQIERIRAENKRIYEEIVGQMEVDEVAKKITGGISRNQ